MSLSLIPLNKLNNAAIKNNILINSPLIITCLVLAYILYTFIFQTFTIFLATFTGALFSLYFIQLKSKAQIKEDNINSLLQIKHQITLSIKCNEQFQLHRDNITENESLSWEPFLNFYNFQTLPSINIEVLSFLVKSEEDVKLYETIVTFNSKVNILSNSLNDLQKYHCVYLEKMNIWESKIKTMKGIRAMHSTELKILREKIGSNLINQLSYLTNIIIEASNSLTDYGNHLTCQLASLAK